MRKTGDDEEDEFDQLVQRGERDCELFILINLEHFLLAYPKGTTTHNQHTLVFRNNER